MKAAPGWSALGWLGQSSCAKEASDPAGDRSQSGGLKSLSKGHALAAKVLHERRWIVWFVAGTRLGKPWMASPGGRANGQNE